MIVARKHIRILFLIFRIIVRLVVNPNFEKLYFCNKYFLFIILEILEFLLEVIGR